MSFESDQARLMAERIAQRMGQQPTSPRPVANGSSDISAELAAMRSSLGQLQDKLIQIEARVKSGQSEYSRGYSQPAVTTAQVPPTHSPWLAGVNAAAHPSQERFGVEEATISELVDFFQNEKTCSLEPGGKPCDHCAMCSSRGF